MAARLHALARTITGPGVAAATNNTVSRLPTTAAFTTTTTAATTIATITRRTHLPTHQPSQYRMASSSSTTPAPEEEVRKYEWLVVVPDKPGMLAKRLEVRPLHFAGLAKAKESGLYKMGGAILEDMPADDEVSSMKFAGSTIMVVAESHQAVVDALKDDVYVTSGVWDLEKAMIWPAKIAFRFP